MYAIVDIAGSQFKVEAGMEIFVNRLAAEKGAAVEFDKVLLFYEKGSEKLSEINFDGCENTAVIIGSEGGFSPREAEKMQQAGAASLLLGQRILRCETAAVTAAALTMFCLGEME